MGLPKNGQLHLFSLCPVARVPVSDFYLLPSGGHRVAGGDRISVTCGDERLLLK